MQQITFFFARIPRATFVPTRRHPQLTLPEVRIPPRSHASLTSSDQTWFRQSKFPTPRYTEMNFTPSIIRMNVIPLSLSQSLRPSCDSRKRLKSVSVLENSEFQVFVSCRLNNIMISCIEFIVTLILLSNLYICIWYQSTILLNSVM